MPKRKALGPVDSDGEEDDYYSFPNTPMQSPFPKSVPNNFHLPSSLKKNSTSSGPSLMSNFGGMPPLPRFGQGSSEQPSRPAPPSFSFGLGSQGSSLSSVPAIGGLSRKPMNTNTNQDFSQSVKDLNNAFISSCRAVFSKNPSHSLIPVVKDYLYHSRVLMEQHRKGGKSPELVNGINSPSKSFRSLGEFFDEFEQTYIMTKQDNPDESGGRTLRTSTASTNSDTSSTLSSASEKSKGFSFNPSPTKDNASSLGAPFTSGSEQPFKFNTGSSSSPTLKTALEGGKPSTSTSSNSFISSMAAPTSRPQQTAVSTPALSASSTMMKTTAPETTKPNAKAPFSGFSFFSPPNPSTSVSLNTNAAPAAPNTEDKNNEEGEAEDDEPPKVELTPVVEDDSVYSVRCKVFNVVDGKCKDKGVGMLYVKKIDGGKHQIVVRADNNLGTVILNILLQKSLPLSRSKNTIMTVELQANNPKAMPIIIKVKSEADATQLLEKLKEFQQSS